MRRHLLVVVLLTCTLAWAPAAAGAQEEEPPPSGEVPVGDIVPRPNSGAEPTDAGDRGGALQLLVLGLIVAVVAFGAWRLSVHIRRADRHRAPPTA